ncbi:MAG: hypothetical protein BJ554DRAFT_4670, partial [Olpidium bornovanus]
MAPNPTPFVDAGAAVSSTHRGTAGAASGLKFIVDSPVVRYADDAIYSAYEYQRTRVRKGAQGEVVVTPESTKYEFRTELSVPRLGLMLVGWGGNNGSTLTASVIANKLNIRWHTKDGVQTPNYFGSLVQASTLKLGTGDDGKDVYITFRDILPMVDPNNIVLGGWDISNM